MICLVDCASIWVTLILFRGVQGCEARYQTRRIMNVFFRSLILDVPAKRPWVDEAYHTCQQSHSCFQRGAGAAEGCIKGVQGRSADADTISQKVNIGAHQSGANQCVGSVMQTSNPCVDSARRWMPRMRA